AAYASRSTNSGVMGSRPTRPRIPSVPKYLRLIVLPRAPAGSRASSKRPPDTNGVHCFPDIVHAHEVRPILDCEERGGNAPGRALAHGTTRDVADRFLARKPHEHAVAHRRERGQCTKKCDCGLERLAESQPEVEANAVRRDARG